MFGLGFTEILLIAVVALLFIGPDKLPDTMKSIARTLGKVKRAFDDTKSTIENELRVSDLREEVLGYRQELEKAKADLNAFKNVASKEIEDVKESAQLPQSYNATDINDDSDIFDEFEKAEAEFKELEKPKESTEYDKPEKIEATYSQASTEIPEDSNQEEKEVAGFKHLKEKEV